jgi:hypothetical protein
MSSHLESLQTVFCNLLLNKFFTCLFHVELAILDHSVLYLDLKLGTRIQNESCLMMRNGSYILTGRAIGP